MYATNDSSLLPSYFVPLDSLKSKSLTFRTRSVLSTISCFTQASSYKIHFLYGGQISDYALNAGFERARSTIVAEFRTNGFDIISSFSIEEVHAYEEEEQLELSLQRLLAKMANEHFDALVCTDPELMSWLLKVQTSMTDGTSFHFRIFGFMNPTPAQSSARTPNVAFFHPPFYLTMYLAGITSGTLASSDLNPIGLIVSDLNDVGSVQNLNAFFLGVHQSNPSARVVVATVDWQNTSIATMAAARSLLDNGAKIVTSAQGNPMASMIFNDNSSLPSIGFGGNQRVWVGENVLSNFLFDARTSFTTMLELVITPPSPLSPSYYPNISAISVGDFSIKLNPSDRLLLAPFIEDAISGRPIFCQQALETVLMIPYSSSNPCLTSEEAFSQAIMIPTRNPSLAIVAHWTTYNATERVYWKYSSGFSVAMLVISGLGCILAGYFAFHAIHHRKVEEYAKATWQVVLLVALAAIPNFASVPAWLGFPTVASCHLRWWLDSLALWLLLTPLLARSYKLYRWKEHRFTPVTLQFKPMYTMSAKELWLYWMIPVALAELVILVFWSSVTPPVPKDLQRPHLEFGTVEAACVNKRSQGPFFAWAAFNACLAAGNAAFLYFLKGIPLSYEATAAGGSGLNLLVLAGLTGFSATIVDRSPVTVALAIGCKLIVGFTSLLLVVAPKWWSIEVRGHVEDLGERDVGKYYTESELTSGRSKSQSKVSRSESLKKDSVGENASKMAASDPGDF